MRSELSTFNKFAIDESSELSMDPFPVSSHNQIFESVPSLVIIIRVSPEAGAVDPSVVILNELNVFATFDAVS